MTDENTSTESTESTEEAGQTGAEGAAEGQEQGNANEPGEGTEGAESEAGGLTLEDAKAALAKTRQSEAKTRTRLRELEAKLSEAKTPEEFQAALEESKAASAAEARSLLVENVALKHRLPDELAEALKGDTREELEAHAKKLAKFAPSEVRQEDPDVSGGLNPDEGEGVFDAQAALKAAREARRSYR